MNNPSHIAHISKTLNIHEKQVSATLALLAEGGTVPFIARYRKERTGSLDEVAITSIRDIAQKLDDLDKRREAIIKSITEQGKLTDDLKKQLEQATTITELEDIYLPYKPKRKTRASVARERGLEPLALRIMEAQKGDPTDWALEFVSEAKEVPTVEDALQGARDIIAEIINEDKEARADIRTLFQQQAQITCKVLPGKEQEAEKYRDYFDWSEPLSKAPSHRILAMRRGEKELFLNLEITPSKEEAIHRLKRRFASYNNPSTQQIELAIEDCYKRLLKPSIETEFRLSSKKMADEAAILVFVQNLKELLMASPLGSKAVLAIDPGFRTGCKVVALDASGALLDHSVIYPHENNRKAEAEAIIVSLAKKYNIEAIAIGNGTAGRETEAFVKTIKILPKEITIVMVNESGASIYSASEVAREEFPNHDITVRGAVSIGRRLADPLAELVKLDPKSIGVGQYQHDVDQNQLKQSLDEVVEHCVNAVGVEINTASKQLLTYVSGLGPQLAENIVQFRTQNGPFKSRKQLLEVPRMGQKAFEQAAGFLRIRNGVHPLDASAVHPESYPVIEKMAKDVKATVAELIQSKEIRQSIDLKKYVTETIGIPTLNDIMAELEKPGRDPRKQFEAFAFQDGVDSITDLRVGMELPGIVTNVTNFGAFVDIGVHQDGLVHVSQLSNKFVKDPNEVVKVQQHVRVTVTSVDVDRKRIALSMVGEPVKQVPKQNTASVAKEESMSDKLSALKGKWK